MFVEWLLTQYLRRLNQSYMRFEPASNLDLAAPQPGRRYLMYVHVPFCEVLCPYCSFHRVKLDREKARSYFRALRAEIKRYHERGYEFGEVYVGGGTPTVLPDEMAETLDLIRSLYRIERISLETNPDHLREDILSLLESAGVNRLSVGVQSFDDDLLKKMARYEKYGSGAEIAERLKATQGRFDTLNADMIFNLPHQSAASLERDVRVLMEEIQVDQVTFYPLMPSVATRDTMARQMGQSGFSREKGLYHLILDSMPAAYRPSSAWCFSRAEAAMIDEYIVDHQEYAGVGSGAFGYLNGTTYANTFSIDRYIDQIGRGRTAITAQRRHSRYEQMQYEFVMGLFGLSLDGAAMEARYGGGYERTLWKEFLAFRLLGAIKKEGERYRLTRRGMYYWVIMMREFFIGVNNFRDQMRAQVDVEPCVDVDGQKKMAPTL